MSITNKAMAPGMNLVSRYKGTDYSCETYENKGKVWYRLPNGSTFKSISGAASSITGIATTNGWMFWTVSGAPKSITMESRTPAAPKKPAKAPVLRRGIRGRTLKVYGVTQEEIDEVDQFLRDTGGYSGLSESPAGKVKYPDGCECGICGAEFPDTMTAGAHFHSKH
jgi:hypothetical protein